MDYSAYAALAKHVVSSLDFSKMKWRHHKFGMLQSELSETLRVHVWHRKLRQIEPGNPRGVHDHRFSLTSAVVAGELHDQYCRVSIYGKVEGGDVYTAWAIKHAKVQTNTEADYTKLGIATLIRTDPKKYVAGDVYLICRRAWHTTIVETCAVTLIWRHEFDDQPARVLTAIDAVLDTGIVKDPDPELMADVLADATTLVKLQAR